MTRLENVNHTKQEPNINQIEQQKTHRKELLDYMITLLNISSQRVGMCGLKLAESELEKYYQKIKEDLLDKHQHLINDYRQSEVKENDYLNLTLILADLRKNIQMIGTNDYYQGITLTTCQHLLEWEK